MDSLILIALYNSSQKYDLRQWGQVATQLYWIPDISDIRVLINWSSSGVTQTLSGTPTTLRNKQGQKLTPIWDLQKTNVEA